MHAIRCSMKYDSVSRLQLALLDAVLLHALREREAITLEVVAERWTEPDLTVSYQPLFRAKKQGFIIDIMHSSFNVYADSSAEVSNSLSDALRQLFRPNSLLLEREDYKSDESYLSAAIGRIASLFEKHEIK
jgi:hypothetical protein